MMASKLLTYVETRTISLNRLPFSWSIVNSIVFGHACSGRFEREAIRNAYVLSHASYVQTSLCRQVAVKILTETRFSESNRPV